MRFPPEADSRYCSTMNCPNRGAGRPKGLAVRYLDGAFRRTPDEPKLLLLFRDPTIERPRKLGYVLDIKVHSDDSVASKLFDPVAKHLLSHLPADTVVYLDNFIRCVVTDGGQPVSLDDLSHDYPRYTSVSAPACFHITCSTATSCPALRAVVFTAYDSIKWLIGEHLLLDQTGEFPASRNKGFNNSTALLAKCFRVPGLDVPVFYFLHPSVLQQQYTRYYRDGAKYHDVFTSGREMIAAAL